MEKILVVDDDEFTRMLTQVVLEHAGFYAECAEDGEIAWKMITEEPLRFDLMLLDKSMPNLDGINLLKRLKTDQRFKDLPVVMLTGASQQQDIVEGLAMGAYYYLTKPAPAEVLKNVMINALAESRKKRELLSQVGHQTEAMRILHSAEFSFSNLQEAKNLALWLADVSMVPELTVNAYSELLINAVEHGNLAISYQEKGRLLGEGLWLAEIEKRLQCEPYASRRVEVKMEKNDNEYVVTIKDQGNGFDWREYLDFSPQRAFDLHGRGIAMARMQGLDAVEYLGCGNTVVTKVKLQ